MLVFACIYECTYARTYVMSCVCVCMYISVCKCVCPYLCVYISVCIEAYRHMNIFTQSTEILSICFRLMPIIHMIKIAKLYVAAAD
jgi:hypothetical protein